MIDILKRAARNLTFDDVVGGVSIFAALFIGLFWVGIAQ